MSRTLASCIATFWAYIADPNTKGGESIWSVAEIKKLGQLSYNSGTIDDLVNIIRHSNPVGRTIHVIYRSI